MANPYLRVARTQLKFHTNSRFLLYTRNQQHTQSWPVLLKSGPTGWTAPQGRTTVTHLTRPCWNMPNKSVFFLQTFFKKLTSVRKIPKSGLRFHNVVPVYSSSKQGTENFSFLKWRISARHHVLQPFPLEKWSEFPCLR